MPIIQCDIREGRTDAQKRALARELTRAVQRTIGAPLEYIYVLIRETPGLHHIKAGKHLPDYEAPQAGRRGGAASRGRSGPRKPRSSAPGKAKQGAPRAP